MQINQNKMWHLHLTQAVISVN